MKTNEHTQVADLLPLYVSGTLDRNQREAVERHLPGCAECQADLELWRLTAGEIIAQDAAAPAPRSLASQALAQIHKPQPTPAGALVRLQRMAQLLRSQVPLVQREIWPASAAVIALGTIAGLIAEQSVVIYALAPLIAAACVSLIYGPDNDPAYELVLSTPTTPRQILLARLVLVFGYNLALALVATLGLLTILAPQPLLGTMILGWLAPMTFLSAAALVLSLWVGASNAISITYIAWLVQLMGVTLRSPQSWVVLSPTVAEILTAYQQFWQSPALLLILAAGLFALAIWLAGRQERTLLNPA